MPLFINRGDKIRIDTRTGSIWSAPWAFGRPVELLPAGRGDAAAHLSYPTIRGQGARPPPKGGKHNGFEQRAAYLKGLMDGLEIDEGKKEGKGAEGHVRAVGPVVATP